MDLLTRSVIYRSRFFCGEMLSVAVEMFAFLWIYCNGTELVMLVTAIQIHLNSTAHPFMICWLSSSLWLSITSSSSSLLSPWQLAETCLNSSVPHMPSHTNLITCSVATTTNTQARHSVKSFQFRMSSAMLSKTQHDNMSCEWGERNRSTMTMMMTVMKMKECWLTCDKIHL